VSTFQSILIILGTFQKSRGVSFKNKSSIHAGCLRVKMSTNFATTAKLKAAGVILFVCMTTVILSCYLTNRRWWPSSAL